MHLNICYLSLAAAAEAVALVAVDGLQLVTELVVMLPKLELLVLRVIVDKTLIRGSAWQEMAVAVLLNQAQVVAAPQVVIIVMALMQIIMLAAAAEAAAAGMVAAAEAAATPIVAAQQVAMVMLDLLVLLEKAATAALAVIEVGHGIQVLAAVAALVVVGCQLLLQTNHMHQIILVTVLVLLLLNQQEAL